MLLLLRGLLQAVKRRQVHHWTKPSTTDPPERGHQARRLALRCREDAAKGSAGSGSGAPVLAGDVITIFHRDVQTVTVGINYLFNWQ